jgi:hypothetical protein
MDDRRYRDERDERLHRDESHDRTARRDRDDKEGRKGGSATIAGQTVAARGQAVTASGLNLVAGIWLLLAPFILGYGGTVAALNNLIVGIIVGVVALVRMFSSTRTNWLSWVNAVAGLWLIFAPTILGYGIGVARTNDVVVGIIVLALGVWSALSDRVA